MADDTQVNPRVYKVADLAREIDATVVGDPEVLVHGLAHPRIADSTDLALAYDASAVRALPQTRACAALLPVVAKDAPVSEAVAARLIAENPRAAMARALALLAPKPTIPVGVHPTAVVDPTAEIGDGVGIGANSVVGARARIGAGTVIMDQVTIGADTVIGTGGLFQSGVRIGERVRIGDRVMAHQNAVIGADGFGFVAEGRGTVDVAQKEQNAFSGVTRGSNESLLRIASAGSVEIGDDVEIGACTTIDRGTLGMTRIGRSTKIDNQVQIAHNCVIGEYCLIAGQVGISGSVTVGNGVVFGGQSGVADHKKIGDHAMILASAGISGNVPDRAIYAGNPAVPRDRKAHEWKSIRRLDRQFARISELEKRIGDLEAMIDRTNSDPD